MTRLLATAVLSTTLCAALGACDGSSAPTTATVTAGGKPFAVKLALDEAAREKGLSGVASLGESEGMLFVFDQPNMQCFWMMNTPSPLTAAFISDDGTIVNLADMKALSTQSHCSARPVRFVLEMNQGWFDKKGLRAGSRLTGEPFTR